MWFYWDQTHRCRFCLKGRCAYRECIILRADYLVMTIAKAVAFYLLLLLLIYLNIAIIIKFILFLYKPMICVGLIFILSRLVKAKIYFFDSILRSLNINYYVYD